MLSLSSLPAAELRQRLHGPGLRLRTGPLVFCIQSRVPQVEQGLRTLYRHYPVEFEGGFADFHVAVQRAHGLRRWWRPQLHFSVAGDSPFAPLPVDQGLPMLEWGMNWCVSGACHQYLILHAAVLERHGRALVMPAPSGSGKSTLCAALLFRGWRLLSDELALIDLCTGQLVPLPRAVSLKNASIEVIQRFAGDAVRFGSVVDDTSKGRVAHFPAPADALRRVGETARPGWVVFPRYRAGAALKVQPMARGRAMMQLQENAFNANVQLDRGFHALADLVQASACHSLEYSQLGQALAWFDALAADDDVAAAAAPAATQAAT